MGIFDFRSGEERERDYRAFKRRVFPGGEQQKERITGLLKKKLPGEDITCLLMFYITVKNNMLDEDGMSFEEAVKESTRKMSVIRVTPQVLQAVQEVMAEDTMR